MTVLVTPTNGPWAATLNIPADGESVNSASVLAYVQEVANRLEYLRQRVPGANPVANIIDRVVAVEMGTPAFAADWVLNAGQGVAALYPAYRQIAQAAATGGPVFDLDPVLLNGQIIRTMAADVVAKNGHAGLPGTMPSLRLLKVSRGVGTAYAAIGGLAATLVDTQNDTSPNTAAYELVHTISKTLAVPETVDLVNYSYRLQCNGEYGANWLISFLILQARIGVSA
jgi:hypothetical protein